MTPHHARAGHRNAAIRARYLQHLGHTEACLRTAHLDITTPPSSRRCWSTATFTRTGVQIIRLWAAFGSLRISFKSAPNRRIFCTGPRGLGCSP
jgi:hypothetical protein